MALTDSPYTDPDVVFTDTDNVAEVELLDEKTQHLRDVNRIYANNKTIMDNILKLYKFLSTKEDKQIWEKTDKDVSDDVAKVDYSVELNNVVKTEMAQILTEQERDKLIQKKYNVVPVFIDFCYIYYIKMSGNKELFFYTMPSNLLKFKFVCATMGCKDVELNALFEDVIQNELMRDVRNNNIPFHLLTDLTADELKEKLYTEILPTLKKILDKVLRMKE